jgi:hypothetical protein
LGLIFHHFVLVFFCLCKLFLHIFVSFKNLLSLVHFFLLL